MKTVEQKAQAYDEALDRAKKEYKNYESFKSFQNVIIRLFPELKESEDKDERIRKALLRFHKSTIDIDGIKGEDILAWLEKQGKQKLVEKYNITGIGSKNAQGKLGEMIKNLKSADKVEPKFHEGEWINGYYTNYKVLSINNEGYVVEDVDGNKINILFENEKFHHLFTVADAKDGDVLCYEDEISIYKHDIKNCTKQETTFGGFVYHCCYDGKRFITDSLYSLTEQDKTDIHPANKEQRGLLFQKIKEAGYEWDAELKQLRKIEQKPVAWSEEDEKMRAAVLQLITDSEKENGWNCVYCNDKEIYFSDIIAWLESLRPQKQWKPSEEQLKSLKGVIDVGYFTSYPNSLETLYEQLRKLKGE